MDDENNEENDMRNEEYHEMMIRQCVRQMILLDKIISESFKDRKNISIMDVGVYNSACCLLYTLIKPNMKTVIGIDRYHADSPWDDLELWKKIDTNNRTIEYIEGNIFNKVEMEILKKHNNGKKIDICYCHQTLHHLRLNNCKFQKCDKCAISDIGCESPACNKAVGVFCPNTVFDTLFNYSDSILISENYFIGEDEDKEIQSGYLTLSEIEKMFKYILNNYNLEFYQPIKDYYPKSSDKNTINQRLNEIKNAILTVDHIAFLVNQDDMSKTS